MTDQIVKPNIIDTIKRKQIIEEIAEMNPTIPKCLLELIWDSVKGIDDRKLKQLRKGTYKIKERIKRTEYTDGQVIKGCSIEEDATVPFKNMMIETSLNSIEEIEDATPQSEVSCCE